MVDIYKEISSDSFLTKFKEQLFRDYFKFDDKKTDEFINFLKVNNAYIGGEYILNALYDIKNDDFDPVIFISNKDVEKLIFNMFPGFVPNEVSIDRRTYLLTNDNYFIIISYNFICGDNKNKVLRIYIYNDVYESIGKFLHKSISLSLFEIWWNPNSDKIEYNQGIITTNGENLEV